MARIVVTGGSGKAGRAVVAELVACGEDVLSADLVTFPGLPCEQVQADLTELGQAVEVLRGASAVVHLAAIPAPGLRPDELTFRVNTESTYNVFSAAATLGLERGRLGLERDGARAAVRARAARVRTDRRGASRPAGVQLRALEAVCRGDGAPVQPLDGHPVRRPALLEHHGTARLRAVSRLLGRPAGRKWNLWGYVDARDVAQSCRLALTSPPAGAEVFIVAAADTVMNRPSAALMAEVFPDVEVRGELGEFETLLSIGKARRLLGYEPAFSWRGALEASRRAAARRRTVARASSL